MTYNFTNSLAAFAAIFLTITSIGTIVSLPPAQAHTAQNTIILNELA